MRNILEACEVNKVKRLVVTLCLVNALGNIFKDKSGDKVYSHKDFAPIEKDDEPGPKSKLVQEKVIMEYLEKQKETQCSNFEVVRILPCMMFGPLLSDTNTFAQ